MHGQAVDVLACSIACSVALQRGLAWLLSWHERILQARAQGQAVDKCRGRTARQWTVPLKCLVRSVRSLDCAVWIGYLKNSARKIKAVSSHTVKTKPPSELSRRINKRAHK